MENNINEFNAIDNKIDNNIENTLNLDTFENDLNNISMSFLNDDNKIVESPTETVSVESTVSDSIVPPVEESKSLFETEPVINDIFEPTPVNNINENNTSVEELINEELPNETENENKGTTLFTFDSEGNVTSVSNQEPVITTDENDISAEELKIEELPNETENENKGTTLFTFDSEGNVTGVSNYEPVAAAEVNYTLSESEAKIDTTELSNEIDMLNSDLNSIDDLIKESEKIGFFNNEYTSPMYENLKLGSELKTKFNSAAKEYLDSISDNNSEKETELTSMQF